MSQIDNMQKYANYKEQFGRLKKALTNGFYLEAIFIEYAIIEDRIESILRHSGKFNSEKHNMLNKKLSKIKDMQREQRGLINKYISVELIEQISVWKENRNRLIHALMKQLLHTEDLQSVALEGQMIAKTISSKTRAYNNALEKIQLEGEKENG
ncbi:MAG: hypothetical protein E7473_00475 [Ruminococcaceae bacterium]|nr:hypothetical protein [Oscillospiraceae bacterium]